MSFATEFHVPGAYHFDTTARPHPALSAGIFLPPISPSASSYNLAKSTGSLYSDVSMSTTPGNNTVKRKRVTTRESTPVEWNMNMDGSNDGKEEEKSVSAGRQVRYTLAGQLNATPLGAPNGAENGLLEDSVYSDIDYRRALGPNRDRDEIESPSIRLAGRHFNPEEPETSSSPGWSALAFHTIGDVMGKVWEFCKTGAFRGFHAGGGEGYEFSGSTVASQTGKPWGDGNSMSTPQTDPTLTDHYQESIPGQFPQPSMASYSPEHHEKATTLESAPRPAVKRRQVSANDELRKNWVMVDEPRDQKARAFGAEVSKAPLRPAASHNHRSSGSGYYMQTAASTSRRISVPTSRISSGSGGTIGTLPRNSRTSLRISHAGSPSLTARAPASYAQPRSPVSRSSPSRIPVPAAPGGLTLKTSYSQSSASAASTGRRSRAPVDKLDPQDIEASPRLDAEAKHLAQKKLAVERETDARVDAFNARLLNMIRQGKEALGTTVEVLGDDDGGGGADGRVGWEDDDDDD
ncbi:hypothetical protein B0T26DRAFT_642438 [Lasiosphaeria miniovina]|uniref:Uncharacterized protein n=1 Tax=Lasiosphaeria miniovina TaxID=1954250 RepID=A0AA40AT73_9PEZI|nr:uncharacterized protein B0T26DRAFT_642438 [Lasiosphaeria miniovina]KAK0721570.1 hypothetical protein B0T26DRAFT_642438 [Lasiosphaeria miniovina]